MSKKVTVEVVDDVDGSPAAETVEFSYQGRGYQIDLSKANAAGFRNMMRQYAVHARRVTAVTARPAYRRRTATDREHGAAVRQWASEQGLQLSNRGRIPSEVECAYEEAHSSPAPARRRTSRTNAASSDEVPPVTFRPPTLAEAAANSKPKRGPRKSGG